MAKGDVCEICQIEDNVYYNTKSGMMLCNKHRQQFNTYGKFLERTLHDPNEFIVNGDILEIVLYDRGRIESGRALVDVKHLEVTKQHKWHLDSNGYVASHSKDKTTLLHRLITNAPKGTVVDHRNHNKLYCSDDNLRICTQSDNMKNYSKSIRNTSGCTGVSWYEPRNKWMVSITVDGQKKHLGYRKELCDAISLRKKAEIKYQGEFRYREEKQ